METDARWGTDDGRTMWIEDRRVVANMHGAVCEMSAKTAADRPLIDS